MVMELIRGETLDQLSQRSGPLPPERAAYLVAQVLGALDHAHRAGIVHRDLKPANVMVTEHGGIKIMDFWDRACVGRRAPDQRRPHDGHTGLHGAGAGARQRGRQPRRRLLLRRRLLPPAHRQAAVRGRHRDRDGPEAVVGNTDAGARTPSGPTAVVPGSA